jgi:hypothetical protein
VAKFRILLIVMAAIGLVLPSPVFGAGRPLARFHGLQPTPPFPHPFLLQRRVPVEILLCFPGNAAQVQRCIRPLTEAESLRERSLRELLADELGSEIQQAY